MKASTKTWIYLKMLMKPKASSGKTFRGFASTIKRGNVKNQISYIFLIMFFRHGYVCLMPGECVGNETAESLDPWIENELKAIENLKREDPDQRGKRFEILIYEIFRLDF